MQMPRTPEQELTPISVARYKRGDYVRIGVAFAARLSSVWMCVDHCDDRARIVFGIIDDNVPEELRAVFANGRRLAASYSRVLEQRSGA